MTKPIVVNMFSGPGAGKSTTAAAVFSLLKMRPAPLERNLEANVLAILLIFRFSACTRENSLLPVKVVWLPQTILDGPIGCSLISISVWGPMIQE